MLACILTIAPLDKSTGARSTMRFSSAADRRVCGLNGVAWEPCMTRAPALGMQFWNGDFEAATDGGKITFSINLAQAKKAFPDITDAVWTGAQVEAFIGRVGAAWPWTSYFKGRITSYGGEWPTLDLSAQVDTEPFNVDVLTATYAGTGGAEGGSDIKGKVKPLALGWPRNVEPVLINAVDSVYQFSAYGAIEAVETLYERASAFPASSGDYANYAALVAADIPAGAWATCLAEGMIRLGAPAFGVITGDIKGHKVGGSAPRGAGALVSALASIAGVSSSLIASSTLAALDAEGATNSDVMVTDQIKFLDAARRLILQCNWQALVSNAGVLAAMKPSLSGTELFTLHAQGKRTPLVTASAEQQVSLPYAKTTMAAERCWRVHTFDEISTSADLIDKGDYDALTVYREGNIVSMPDGSRWVYISAAPQAGVEPGTNGAVWEELSAAFAGAFSARLTNESHVVAADSTGAVVSFADAGGTFVVEDSSGTAATGVVFSVFSETGVDISIDPDTGVYGPTSMSADSGVATLRAVLGSLTFDRVYSIAKAKAGEGDNPVYGYLTNESHVVPADSSGNITGGALSSAGGTFIVYDGLTQLAAGEAAFSVYSSSGLSISINASTGVYTIASMSADVGTAVLQAVYGTTTIYKAYAVAKSKAGAAGSNAKTLTLMSDRQTIYYDAAGSPIPSTQTTTFSTNKQNTTATVNWSITDAAGVARTPVTSYLSASTGDTVTMTEAQFNSARNGTSGVIVTATLTDGTTIVDRISIVRVQQGATGATGSTGAAGAAGANAKTLTVLSNRQTISYDANNNPSPSSQDINFSVNKQNSTATVNWSLTDANGVSRPTGFFSTSSGDSTVMTANQFDGARNGTSGIIVTATMVDGSSITDRISITKVAEGPAGAAGANAKTLTLISDRQTIAYDAAGAPSPSTQTTTFTVNKQNTTATVTWTLTDANGVTRSTTYLSASTGDTVTMTAANFDAARNGTAGVIVTASVTDGTTFTDRISVVKVQAGAAGANGADGANGSNGADAKTLTVLSDRQTVYYDAAGNPSPSVQTTTFSTNKQNTTATVNWSITDAAGVARTPVTSYLSAATGNSVTMTEAQFASARNGTSGVIVTATLTDGSTITDKISVTRVQEGAAGATGPAGADAKSLSISATATAFTFDGSGAASPSSQSISLVAKLENLSGTASWSATAYNASGTVLGAVTLGGSGNARTISNAQFTANSGTAYVVVTATLSTYSATFTIVKVQNGADGATGPSGISAFLSNDAFVVPAYADGTVTSYTGATGSFKVMSGGVDVSSSFTLSTATGGNPQLLTVSYASQTYSVTAGFDASEDIASLTIRATGSGAYSGITIDRVFSLAKLKGGYEIVSALPSTNLFAGRIVFLTTDGKLYRYTSGAWSKAVDGADLVANSVTTHSLGAGVVTAAKLAATNVITVSAQIGDGLVTNAKIGNLEVDSAKIANLTLGTGKLADNAVSQILDAYTSGTLGSTVATANNLTAQSVSITATGAPILVVASFSLRYLTYLAAASPCKVQALVQIYRGANELTARACEFVTMGAGDDITVPVALSVRNTPSAGTHTYTIKVTILDGNTEYFAVAGRSLTLMELKK